MKTVLITGATRGIGASIATIFAKNNYNLILNYYNGTENAIKFKELLEKEYNANILLIKADISKEEEVIRLLDESINKFGSIDILINNAGISIDTTIEDKTVDNFKRILDVNLIGPFLTCKYIGKKMYENKSGSIVNISSDNSIDSYYPESMDYDSSKAGLNILTKDFAKLYSPYVLVNAIAPGWVNTDMNKELDKTFIDKENEKILLNRFARPEEIAKVIYFLATPDASYINSEVIRIDGGFKC